MAPAHPGRQPESADSAGWSGNAARSIHLRLRQAHGRCSRAHRAHLDFVRYLPALHYPVDLHDRYQGMKRKRFYFHLWGIVFLLLSACAPASTATQSATETTAPTQGLV